MKAKELMVGNWVKVNGQPIKVENIQTNCINYVPDIPYVQEEDYINISDIEGIPLAKDILEKNFPTHHHGYFDTYKVNDEIMIEDRSDFMKESYFCVCQGNYPTSSYWTCTIKYVHQLQNALALHGIEKEIEL